VSDKTWVDAVARLTNLAQHLDLNASMRTGQERQDMLNDADAIRIVLSRFASEFAAIKRYARCDDECASIVYAGYTDDPNRLRCNCGFKEVAARSGPGETT
jgi:hypothetical protein